MRPPPSKHRVAENASQNAYRQRIAHGELLAETPLSLALQRMLIDDGYVELPEKTTKRQKKRLFGEGIALALEGILASRQPK